MKITKIEFDEGNELHATRHRVSATEIRQMFMNNPVVRRNRTGRTATYLAVGKTDGGRVLVVPFVLIGTTARPVAAWERKQ